MTHTSFFWSDSYQSLNATVKVWLRFRHKNNLVRFRETSWFGLKWLCKMCYVRIKGPSSSYYNYNHLFQVQEPSSSGIQEMNITCSKGGTNGSFSSQSQMLLFFLPIHPPDVLFMLTLLLYNNGTWLGLCHYHLNINTLSFHFLKHDAHISHYITLFCHTAAAV